MTRQHKVHPARIVHHLRADAKKLQTKRPNQNPAAQILKQDIPHQGRPHAKLIRPPPMATGPVGKHIQFLFLDPVFPVTLGIVPLIIKRLRRIPRLVTMERGLAPLARCLALILVYRLCGLNPPGAKMAALSKP